MTNEPGTRSADLVLPTLALGVSVLAAVAIWLDAVEGASLPAPLLLVPGLALAAVVLSALALHRSTGTARALAVTSAVLSAVVALALLLLLVIVLLYLPAT
ncbi:MAG: hypothetical protein ACTHKG_02845 [Nocardioides sp.]